MTVLAACSDNSLPEVDISVSMHDVSLDGNNVICVAQGKPFSIDSLVVKSLNDKAAGLTNVRYFWDYRPLYYTDIVPFALNFNTNNMQPGNHLLQIVMNVLQVDKSIAVSSFTYMVKVYPSVESMPENLRDLGPVTDVMHCESK